MPDQTQSNNHLGAGSLLRPFLTGGLICFSFGLLDHVLLDLANRHHWEGWPVWIAFVLFVIQCFAISFFTGRQLINNRSLVWAWTFFYLWCMLMMNLFLGQVFIESVRVSQMQISLVFAFLQAQMGLMIIWGILGGYDWRKRIPLFVFGFGLFGYPLWLMDFGSYVLRGWFGLLVFYLVAILLTTLILRLFRFRITSLEFEVDPEKANTHGQFSVFNLFVWTTIAAVAVGVGRFVPWELVWDSVWASHIRFSIIVSVLLTVVAVTTCWAALGKTNQNKYVSVLIRTPILLIMFVGIAFSLYFFETVRGGGAGPWSNASFVGGWRLNPNVHFLDIFGIWSAWTVLNGFFLYGLLQVLGAAGCRLVRKPRHVAEN